MAFAVESLRLKRGRLGYSPQLCLYPGIEQARRSCGWLWQRAKKVRNRDAGPTYILGFKRNLKIPRSFGRGDFCLCSVMARGCKNEAGACSLPPISFSFGAYSPNVSGRIVYNDPASRDIRGKGAKYGACIYSKSAGIDGINEIIYACYPYFAKFFIHIA